MAVHSMPFKRKVKHMCRRGFYQIPRNAVTIDRCVVMRCVRCGWVGLGAYLFKGPGWRIVYFFSKASKREYYQSRTQICIVRKFAVCDGCGHWTELNRDG